MNLADAEAIHAAVSRTAHDALRRDLIEAAARYAGIRVQYFLAAPEERAEIEDARTRAHDALIGACDILSRAMAGSGEMTSWRADLGQDRRRIGDFACLLAAIVGLRA